VGMRLLYHGVESGRLLKSRKVERVRLLPTSFPSTRVTDLIDSDVSQELKEWSIREGRKFDDPHHARKRIEAFKVAYDSAFASPRTLQNSFDVADDAIVGQSSSTNSSIPPFLPTRP
jgi:hypothetical protein